MRVENKKTKMRRAWCLVLAAMLCLQMTACRSEEQASMTNTEVYATEEQSDAAETKQDASGVEEDKNVAVDETQSDTMQQTADQPEENGLENAQNGSSEIVGMTDMSIEELMVTWSWDGLNPVYLAQVLADLEGCHISYEGYYNVSGERLDLTLEDGTNLIFLATTLEPGDPNEPERYELMMKGTEFNADGFQEHYLHCYDVIIYDYFWPDLSEEELTEDVLYQLNQTDLSIVRNQLFAKYGRKFKDAFLSAIFSQKDWYDPQYEGTEFDSNMQKVLSDLEKENLRIIMEFEEQLYYRKESGKSYETARDVLSGSWIDLDNDGTLERLLYDNGTPEGEDMGTAVIMVSEEASGQTVKAEIESFSLHSHCYVLNMEDGSTLLLIAEDGISDDFYTSFYRYEEGKLVELGGIPGKVREIKAAGKTLTASVETVHIQCEPLTLQYTIKNNQIVCQEQEYYEYRGNTATVLKALNLYGEKGASKATKTVGVGEEICILGGDLNEWVQIEITATGEKGWLKVKDNKCELSDGTMDMTGACMDGLTFYG